METVILVFIFASVATYLPIYWGLSKAFDLYARWRTPAADANPSARDEFLQCLKSEAVKRASKTLAAALQEVRVVARRRNLPVAPLSEEWLAMLTEARLTLRPLLSRSELAEFDSLTQLLADGDVRRLIEIENRIESVKAFLMNPRRRLRSTIAPLKQNHARSLVFQHFGAAPRESFA